MFRQQNYMQKRVFKAKFQHDLSALCRQENGRLQNAKYFLMMPEYLSFKLTGVCKNEYTNATTTGLVNANEKIWDTQIIHALGLTEELFKPLFLPSSFVGDLSDRSSKE